MRTITALTVNYNTPEVLERLLSSFRLFYTEVPLVVVDGSDVELYEKIKDFPGRFNVELIHFDYNIHHAGGIIHGFNHIKTDTVLLLDSDLIVLNGWWIESMMNALDEHSYGIGDVQSQNTTPYLHPVCALINRDVFFQYPMPIKHGMPFCVPMLEIQKRGQHALQNAQWLTDDLWKHAMVYVQHNDNNGGGGTVSRTYGYHLD